MWIAIAFVSGLVLGAATAFALVWWAGNESPNEGLMGGGERDHLLREAQKRGWKPPFYTTRN